MSNVKNFFSKKGSKIDGTVAIGIVLGALAISGFNVASASTEVAEPVQTSIQTSIQTVVTSGDAGMNIVNSGTAGLVLGK